MAIRADYLCYFILGSICLTSISATATRSTIESKASSSTNAKQLVKQFEGFHSCPYADTNGQFSIGYGNSFHPDGTPVKRDDPCIDQKKAEEMMQSELNRVAQKVEQLVTVPMTTNQRTALQSFTFNVGIDGLKDSTLLRKLNLGDSQGAAKEFDRWIHGDGKPMPGLVKRRSSEKQLFKKP